MKLIQSWIKLDRDLLLKSIKDSINIEFTDIIIYGSRIFGDFNPTSDIDVVIYTKNYEEKKTFSYYFEGVKNPESKYNNIRVSIKYKSDINYLEDTWESCGYTYFLPRYSLLTDTFYEGNNNHVLHHQGMRALIKECNGWNVPFEEYKIKNSKLLE
jgi:predicted nucleotidyltransferase